MIASDAMTSIKKQNLKIFVYFVFLIGVLCRFISWMSPQPFWSDEMATLFFARLPIHEAITRDHHFFYSQLLRLWDFISPESERGLRSLSLLISLATFTYAHWRWRNIWLTLLLAVNPASIYFASELKSSALFEFSALLFMGTVTQNPLKINYLIFTGLFVTLAHPLGIFLPLSYCLLQTIITRQKIKSYYAFYTLLLASMALVLFNYAIKLNALAWLKNYPASHLWGKLYSLLFDLFTHSELWMITGISMLIWSTVQQKNKYSLWFVITFALYIAAILYSDLNLGISRFIVPLSLIMLLALSDSFEHLLTEGRTKTLWAVCGFCVFINLKCFALDLTLNKSAWQEAAQDFCKSPSNLPAFYFGHAGIQYYLKCARQKWIPDELPNETRWLVTTFQVAEFEKQLVSIYGGRYTLTKTQEYNLKSNEPVIAYDLKIK